MPGLPAIQLRGQKCSGAARGYKRFPSGKQPPSAFAFGLGRVFEGVGLVVVFFFFPSKIGWFGAGAKAKLQL